MSPRKVEHAARNAGDRYITTPEAAAAIGGHLAAHYGYAWSAGNWLDPACAFGTLPHWAGIERTRANGMELGTAPGALTYLGYVNDGVDSLREVWPASWHIIANPPFLLLSEYVARIAEHCDTNQTIGAILTPAAFWHAASRAQLPTPHEMLALTWRPNFSCGIRADGSTGAAPSADYVWVIYDGESSAAHHAQWSRLARPVVSVEWTREHESLARLSAGMDAKAPAPLFG